MKVKNIVFSGVMAAILGATSANAAVTVASQGYVDSRVDAVETNITNNYLTKNEATNTYLTETQVTQQITNVVGTSENGVLADVAANKTAIAGLQSSKANADDVYTKTKADELLATKADKTKVAEDIASAVAGKANTADVYSKTDADSTFATKTALAGVDAKFANYTTTEGLTTKLADYTKTSELNSTFATDAELKAVDDKFADYTTTADLTTTLNNYATTTALKAEEDARKAADQAATAALANVYTKEQADAEFDKAGSAAGVEAKLKLLATADVPEACQSESNTCVLSMTSDGTFAWTPLTATPAIAE